MHGMWCFGVGPPAMCNAQAFAKRNVTEPACCCSTQHGPLRSLQWQVQKAWHVTFVQAQHPSKTPGRDELPAVFRCLHAAQPGTHNSSRPCYQPGLMLAGTSSTGSSFTCCTYAACALCSGNHYSVRSPHHSALLTTQQKGEGGASPTVA
jgi:hypothetical protein